MSIADCSVLDEVNTLKKTVCVIGSGPAGGVLAVELAKKNIDTILLEAGSSLPHYGNETIASTTLRSEMTNLRFGWSRQLGGSSALWAGRTHPLEPIDFEKRSWVPHSGWPFSMEAMTPYYQKAGALLGIPGYRYFEKYGEFDGVSHGFNAMLNAQEGLESRCFQWGETPFLVSDYLEKMLKECPCLDIVLNAPVSRLQARENGASIDAALVVKPDGQVMTIQADYFVLAAGGIETPRILLNSNQLNPLGVGNDHDVVGRYFSTHPKADMAAIILNKSVSTSHAFFMDHPLDHGCFRYGLGFSKEVQIKKGLLNHYVQLSPLLEYQANKAFERLKNNQLFSNTLIDRSQLIQGFLPGLGKMAYEAMGRIAKMQPRTKKLILRGFLDQYPNKENRVTLSNETMHDGTCKVDIQWKYTYQDKQSVIDFFNALDAVLKKHHVGKVEYSSLEPHADWPLVGIHSHFMGTTRMGEDRKTSVTDPHAQVHGVDNLYISGPSLFPTYGFANPFLTIVALSIRLSDRLLEKIHGI